jgi:hypothetical protein
LICNNSYYGYSSPNNSCKLQQINSLYIENVREINISLIHFDGFTKGFFINCDVDSLNEIKFLIDGIERINYHRFYIDEYCTRINPRMLYIPISANNTLHTLFNFTGALNISNLHNSNSRIQLRFNASQNYIGIHNLYENNITYSSGGVGLDNVRRIGLIWMTAVEILESNRSDIGNIINDLSNNVVFSNNVISKHIGQDEDNICLINHEPIRENEKYMECTSCNKKYFEVAIKHWLNMREINNRTCPNCRCQWTDFNTYLNTPHDVI